jgi:glucose-1-phosphate adenylyltransferase
MKVLALTMAGGRNENLGPLTLMRCEASLPFAGKYRVIDFVLSNCSNSEIYNVGVLTQYMPRSIHDHIGAGKPWELDRSRGGIRVLQPYLGPGIGGWQKGSADAIRRNLDYVEEQRADTVLILGGNHVYKMDYRPMLQQHMDTNADLTIGIRSVNPFETHRFGIVSTDPNRRVTGFQEKPKRSRDNVASMGIYIFKADILRDHLSKHPGHLDFGRDVLPALIRTHKVFSYKYEGYWSNVSTLQAYWEANMALLADTPALDLYDPDWVIHTRSEEQPSAKIGVNAQVGNNLLSNGSIVDGTVERSLISPGVHVHETATVVDSVIMNDCVIGPGAIIKKAIIDKDVIIGDNVQIGNGNGILVPNNRHPEMLNIGLTVIGKRVQVPSDVEIGHNVMIDPYVASHQLAGGVANGETIRKR